MKHSPWPREVAVVAGVGALVAAALIILATVVASGETRVTHQLAWTSVAVTGLVVAAVCNAFVVLTARQALRTRASRLGGNVVLDTDHGVPLSVEDSDRLVAGRAMTLYHRPDCLLVEGKNVRAAARALHERRGRKPCGVCRP